MRISEILRTKGDNVVTIGPEATVREVVSRLAEYNLGAMVVTTDGTTVEGIVSERDVVRRLELGPESLDHKVADIMSSEVRTCAPDATVGSLMRLMTDERIRHVPIVVDGRLAGIISIGDVVKSRIEELEFQREQLNQYVSGAQ